jgi:phage terminase small subunit
LPEPEGTLTDPPDWFDAEQRAGWQYAIEQRARRPSLLKLDRAALVAFVCAENEYRKAALLVAGEGQFVESPEKGVLDASQSALAIMNKQAL